MIVVAESGIPAVSDIVFVTARARAAFCSAVRPAYSEMLTTGIGFSLERSECEYKIEWIIDA